MDGEVTKLPRAAWMQSTFGIRSDMLQGSIKDIIKMMSQVLDEQQVCSFISLLWAIWRTRSDATIGGKKVTPQSCTQHFQIAENSCRIRSLTSAYRSGQHENRVPDPIAQTGVNPGVGDYRCFVDGSWDQNGMAGIGMCLVRQGRIFAWVSKLVSVISPTKAEALAVVEGYKLLLQRANGEGCVQSDSKETVDALAGRIPIMNDWRSYEEIWAAWMLQTASQGKMRAVFCSRENAGLMTAHFLANQGRMKGWERTSSNSQELNLQIPLSLANQL